MKHAYPPVGEPMATASIDRPGKSCRKPGSPSKLVVGAHVVISTVLLFGLICSPDFPYRGLDLGRRAASRRRAAALAATGQCRTLDVSNISSGSSSIEGAPGLGVLSEARIRHACRA